ncbi:hypothetical protein Taro_023357 [Colocasia esculenta]|uniref:Isopenicillin N synthase-like Fe(2+) 2OG dioxygenase domain-containing protein n=1 Tax=Colocasia esculenta TaxID=4460 RepID=A0A843VE88_COLES|nr:hypothetical protein [Colocasia esculenta]
MAAAMEAEVLEPLALRYSDLLLLSSSPSGASSLPSQELGRLESLSSRVMEALGPSGPGLLCVTDVPGAPAMCRALLPLARKLALLAGCDRTRVLKSHGLGTDVPLKNPDRNVSSFAGQLKYTRDPSLEVHSSLAKHQHENGHILEENRKDIQDVFDDSEFSQLGDAFKDLGFCMMELGLRLAQLCDSKMGSQELELSMLEACTAKGRLIHYHSNLDNVILKEIKKRAKGSGRKPSVIHRSVPQGSRAVGMSNPLNSGKELQNKQDGPKHLGGESNAVTVGCRTSLSDLWQQWHYDYGIFTVLTSPMFLCLDDAPQADLNGTSCIPSSQECSPPDGHTCLQLLDSTANKVLMVKAPLESFIIQVGESADILSNGRLRSTLHSVCRPAGLRGLSRETFVVFLQPAWDKTFSPPDHVLACGKELASSEEVRAGHGEKNSSNFQLMADENSYNLKEEILKAVPPLCSRLRASMTFAEFSRETTKQYYGGSGTQSIR